jgi:hypothetical protein
MNEFFERVRADAPISVTKPRQLLLGLASLAWQVREQVVDEHAFQESNWDVVAGGTLTLAQETVAPYRGRSSSLWYARLPKANEYRWYEVSYMDLRGRGDEQIYPFALENTHDADLAASPVMHVFQHASRPMAIDDEDFETFFTRWMTRLALAAEAKLTRPFQLPE